MQNNYRSHIIAYTLITFFFWLDICTFSFFEQPTTYFLLCTYICLLFAPNLLLQIWSSLLLLLESFIYFGLFELPLIYLIPLTVISVQMRKILYINRFFLFLAGIIGILTQYLLIEGIIIHKTVLNHYTIVKISANIIIMGIFSLTLKNRDSQDNRHKK